MGDMTFAAKAKALEEADGVGVALHRAALGACVSHVQKMRARVAYAPAQDGAGNVGPSLGRQQ